ncbi:MAG: type II toxin-antitoxin system VapC family toxin [Infirmifilum sp.]
MPTRLVVADASVAVKWVILEAYSDHAFKLRDDLLDGLVEVHAPAFFLVEVASALRKYVIRGLVRRSQAERAFGLIAESGVVLHNLEPGFIARSLQAGLDLGVTVYDAAYIVLADSLGALMYTADEGLLGNHAVRGLGVVRHVKDYEGSQRT